MGKGDDQREAKNSYTVEESKAPRLKEVEEQISVC